MCEYHTLGYVVLPYETVNTIVYFSCPHQLEMMHYVLQLKIEFLHLLDVFNFIVCFCLTGKDALFS